MIKAVALIVAVASFVVGGSNLRPVDIAILAFLVVILQEVRERRPTETTDTFRLYDEDDDGRLS